MFNYPNLTKVTPLAHLRLVVEFSDKVKGEVLFKETHLYGVFNALKDPSFFNQVHCQNGYVEWPGEIDLAPDAMYHQILKNGVWVLE